MCSRQLNISNIVRLDVMCMPEFLYEVQLATLVVDRDQWSHMCFQLAVMLR